MKRRQVDVLKQRVGDVRRIVISTTVSRAITGEVFNAGENVIWTTNERALKTAHLCGGDGRAEERFFARAFDNASPARVAGDVHHRREGPVNADGAGFASGDSLRLLDQ